MKTLRVLYMLAVYIVATPLFTIVGLGFFVWLCIKNKIEYGETGYKEMFKSGVEGIKIGHKCNMIWVKYGNSYELDDLIREFGG